MNSTLDQLIVQNQAAYIALVRLMERTRARWGLIR